ncbi:MAG TPA: cupin domain-containing protein [Parasulfuritortus sp.]
MRKIEPYMEREDIRGKLIGLLNEGTWEEFNYLETRSGEVRGNHYHKVTREVFFIIEGEVDVVTQRPGHAAEEVRLHAGDVLEIEPGETHTFFCRTETKWINVLSRRFDAAAPDIHRSDT